MRKSTLIGLLSILAGLGSVGYAQVSTFPSPPPLSPSSDQSPNSTTNASPITSSVPPDTSSNPGGTATAPGNSPNNPVNGIPSGDLPGSGAPASSFPPASTSPDLSDTPITAATLNSMSALDDKVTLEAGDRISFRVIEDRDDAVPRLVTDTGEVDFPYIGRLKVAGLTCRQVALELKKLLEVDYYKRATVIVGLDVIVGHTAEQQARDVAWIVGQVHQVGPQEISKVQPLTVSQLILRAGGFGDFADERRVRLVHRSTANQASPSAPDQAQNGDKGEIVDVKSIYQGNHTYDPIVQPNDLIIVPKKVLNF